MVRGRPPRKVAALVSAAMIDAITAHHGTRRPPSAQAAPRAPSRINDEYTELPPTQGETPFAQIKSTVRMSPEAYAYVAGGAGLERTMDANLEAFASRRFWVILALCLGLVLSPAALAQKGKAASTDKVNINTATVEQLQTLPGIGPAMAKSIVDYRTKVGKFTKIEELINVKGIGEKGAKELVASFGPLEGVYAHLGELKGKRREALEAGKDDAFRSRELATVRRDAPVPGGESASSLLAEFRLPEQDRQQRPPLLPRHCPT